MLVEKAMDEEKVTQTAMEPAQQPKPKARGGQRTQGIYFIKKVFAVR